jgi:hypothetical protein
MHQNIKPSAKTPRNSGKTGNKKIKNQLGKNKFISINFDTKLNRYSTLNCNVGQARTWFVATINAMSSNETCIGHSWRMSRT